MKLAKRVISKMRERHCAINALMKIVKPNFSYLEKGIYYLDIQCKIIYKVGYKKYYLFQRKHVFMHLLNSKKSSIRTTVSNMFFKRKHLVCIFKNNSLFNGTLGLIGTDSNDFKAFDYHKDKVLTSYDSKEKYKIIKKNIRLMSSAGFNLNTFFTFNNKYGNCIVEKFIHQVDYNHYYGIQSVIKNCYETQSTKNNVVYSDLSFSIVERYTNYFKKVGLSNEWELWNEEVRHKIPCCLCHGDLHYLNYIYDGATFYYVDLESVNYHVFFYDIFFYVFIECYRFNDRNLITSLFKGLFENDLCALFRLHGIVYKKGLLKIYLLLTLIEYYEWEIPNIVISMVLAV